MMADRWSTPNGGDHRISHGRGGSGNAYRDFFGRGQQGQGRQDGNGSSARRSPVPALNLGPMTGSAMSDHNFIKNQLREADHVPHHARADERALNEPTRQRLGQNLSSGPTQARKPHSRRRRADRSYQRGHRKIDFALSSSSDEEQYGSRGNRGGAGSQVKSRKHRSTHSSGVKHGGHRYSDRSDGVVSSEDPTAGSRSAASDSSTDSEVERRLKYYKAAKRDEGKQGIASYGYPSDEDEWIEERLRMYARTLRDTRRQGERERRHHHQPQHSPSDVHPGGVTIHIHGQGEDKLARVDDTRSRRYKGMADEELLDGDDSDLDDPPLTYRDRHARRNYTTYYPGSESKAAHAKMANRYQTPRGHELVRAVGHVAKMQEARDAPMSYRARRALQGSSHSNQRPRHRYVPTKEDYGPGSGYRPGDSWWQHRKEYTQPLDGLRRTAYGYHRRYHATHHRRRRASIEGIAARVIQRHWRGHFTRGNLERIFLLHAVDGNRKMEWMVVADTLNRSLYESILPELIVEVLVEETTALAGWVMSDIILQEVVPEMVQEVTTQCISELVTDHLADRVTELDAEAKPMYGAIATRSDGADGMSGLAGLRYDPAAYFLVHQIVQPEVESMTRQIIREALADVVVAVTADEREDRLRRTMEAQARERLKAFEAEKRALQARLRALEKEQAAWKAGGGMSQSRLASYEELTSSSDALMAPESQATWAQRTPSPDIRRKRMAALAMAAAQLPASRLPEVLPAPRAVTPPETLKLGPPASVISSAEHTQISKGLQDANVHFFDDLVARELVKNIMTTDAAYIPASERRPSHKALDAAVSSVALADLVVAGLVDVMAQD